MKNALLTCVVLWLSSSVFAQNAIIEKIKNDAIALRAQIEALTIVIGTKASSNGKIFGSVNNIQLAEAIQKQGVEVDRKCILVKGDNIKELGKYVAKIKLHKEVEFELPFEVVAE